MQGTMRGDYVGCSGGGSGNKELGIAMIKIHGINV